MFHKTNFSFLGREISILLRIAKERTVYHYGVGNRCKDGRYVLLLDYDETPFEWIQEEVRLLQNDTRLGTAHIFRTKHGYHVIFLEKHTLGELISFLEVTTVDKNYRTVPMSYGRKIWILRQSSKKSEEIRHVQTIPSKNASLVKRDRSKAHALFLLKKYNIWLDKKNGGKFDTEETLILAWYRIAEEND